MADAAQRPGPHPGLVLAHGLGATDDMLLAQYERHFAAAGIATLAFDYRHTGESGGEPRQQFSMRRHRQDVEAALGYLRRRDSIDGARVGLWGTSLGAMRALRAAARSADVAAVVVQCPIVHGPATLRRNGFRPIVRLTPAVARDAIHRVRGTGRRYVPIVGRPAAWPRSLWRERGRAGIRPSRRATGSITAWPPRTPSVSR